MLRFWAYRLIELYIGSGLLFGVFRAAWLRQVQSIAAVEEQISEMMAARDAFQMVLKAHVRTPKPLAQRVGEGALLKTTT